MTHQCFTKHLREIHGILTYRFSNDEPLDRPPCLYTVHMPSNGIKTPCLVPDCPASPSTRTQILHHFATMHVIDSILIPKGGPTVRCPHCLQFMTHVTPQHLISKTCSLQASWFEAHVQCLQQNSLLSTTEFHVNKTLIGKVPFTKYLGQ